jgi:hypothetical protein
VSDKTRRNRGGWVNMAGFGMAPCSAKYLSRYIYIPVCMYVCMYISQRAPIHVNIYVVEALGCITTLYEIAGRVAVRLLQSTP